MQNTLLSWAMVDASSMSTSKDTELTQDTYLRPGPLELHQRQVGWHACLHLLVQAQTHGQGQMQSRGVWGPLQAWATENQPW